MISFAPNLVNSFDAYLLKTAFQDWSKPLVTIHDCIAVLPNDMDDAQVRICHAMIHVLQGNSLSKFIEGLDIKWDQIELLDQGAGCLMSVLKADKMFN